MCTHPAGCALTHPAVPLADNVAGWRDAWVDLHGAPALHAATAAEGSPAREGEGSRHNTGATCECMCELVGWAAGSFRSTLLSRLWFRSCNAHARGTGAHASEVEILPPFRPPPVCPSRNPNIRYGGQGGRIDRVFTRLKVPHRRKASTRHACSSPVATARWAMLPAYSHRSFLAVPRTGESRGWRSWAMTSLSSTAPGGTCR